MSDMLRLSPRRLALVLLAGMALSAAGCDGDNSASLALKKAEAEIRGLIPGSEHVPHAQLRQNTYSNVLTMLGPVAQTGTESQKAAAAAMIAQAKAGLAEGPAEAAAELERQTHSAIITLRAVHSQFLTHSSLADAAAAYNPQPELDEIDAQVRKLEQEQAGLEQQKAEIDQKAQQLRDQAKGLMDQARGKRAEAAVLKGKIANETATRGEELMRQAYELARQADGLELQAATLEAQAAKIEPDSAQAQLDIDRVNDQKQLLAAARQDVQKRTQASRAQAAEARAAAGKVADDIKEIVRQTDSMRGNELAKSWEEAAQGYEQAASSAAQSAARGSRAAAQMAVGSYQQSRGDVLVARAQGMEDWAMILEALATSKPPVSADYATLAERTRGEAKELLEQAREAYKAADQAFSQGGASGQAAQHVTRVNEQLRRAVERAGGSAEDLAAMATATPAGDEGAVEETGGEEVAAGESTPNATLAAIMAMTESGDYSNFADYFVAQTPEDRQMVQALSVMAKSQSRLQKAMEKRFGEDGREMMSGAAQMGGGGGLPTDIDPEDVEFEIEDDTATANANGQQLVMRLVDGVWKIDMNSMGLPAEALAMMSSMAPTVARVLDELAAEVEAGKYNSAQEVGAVMMQKMAEAMGMGGMGGGRPGGRGR